MNYEDIKTVNQRCEEHPDHQQGMISYMMLSERLEEEVDELRAFIEKREWVGLTDDEIDLALVVYDSFWGRLDARKIEAKLKEKNT